MYGSHQKSVLTYISITLCIHLLIFGGVYFLVSLLLYTHKVQIDFSSFYASISPSNINTPYTLSTVQNLNPPFFVLLCKPLAYLNFEHALYLWQLLSFMSLVMGGLLVLKQLNYPTNYWLLTLCFCYPCLLNMRLGQIGTIIFFMLMLGYDRFKAQQPILAGVIWGCITAIKFFPALLLVYLFSQRQFKLTLYFILSFLIASLLPILIWGSAIYTEYFTVVKKVYWYGYSWNGSLLGFLFRSIINFKPSLTNIYQAKIISYGGNIIGLVAYLYYFFKNYQYLTEKQAFVITLTAMIFFCPLGWLYYWPLLFFPILYLIERRHYISTLNHYLLLIGLLFALWPTSGVFVIDMSSWFYKLSLYSINFYGLCLLFILLLKLNHKNENSYNSSLYIFVSYLIGFILFGYSLFLFMTELGKLLLHTNKLIALS